MENLEPKISQSLMHDNSSYRMLHNEFSHITTSPLSVSLDSSTFQSKQGRKHKLIAKPEIRDTNIQSSFRAKGNPSENSSTTDNECATQPRSAPASVHIIDWMSPPLVVEEVSHSEESSNTSPKTNIFNYMINRFSQGESSPCANDTQEQKLDTDSLVHPLHNDASLPKEASMKGSPLSMLSGDPSVNESIMNYLTGNTADSETETSAKATATTSPKLPEGFDKMHYVSNDFEDQDLATELLALEEDLMKKPLCSLEEGNLTLCEYNLVRIVSNDTSQPLPKHGDHSLSEMERGGESMGTTPFPEEQDMEDTKPIDDDQITADISSIPNIPTENVENDNAFQHYSDNDKPHVSPVSQLYWKLARRVTLLVMFLSPLCYDALLRSHLSFRPAISVDNTTSTALTIPMCPSNYIPSDDPPFEKQRKRPISSKSAPFPSQPSHIPRALKAYPTQRRLNYSHITADPMQRASNIISSHPSIMSLLTTSPYRTLHIALLPFTLPVYVLTRNIYLLFCWLSLHTGPRSRETRKTHAPSRWFGTKNIASDMNSIDFFL